MKAAHCVLNIIMKDPDLSGFESKIAMDSMITTCRKPLLAKSDEKRLNTLAIILFGIKI